jgi:hypothetical protein
MKTYRSIYSYDVGHSLETCVNDELSGYEYGAGILEETTATAARAKNALTKLITILFKKKLISLEDVGEIIGTRLEEVE